MCFLEGAYGVRDGIRIAASASVHIRVKFYLANLIKRTSMKEWVNLFDSMRSNALAASGVQHVLCICSRIAAIADISHLKMLYICIHIHMRHIVDACVCCFRKLSSCARFCIYVRGTEKI